MPVLEFETKVGPKGWEHNWIFVGVPGAGAAVHHPQHGAGVVSKVTGTHVRVTFARSGDEHAFERVKGGTGPGRLAGRDESGANRFAGHAADARKLAADARASGSNSAGHAATELDTAAAHLDAGRPQEAIGLIRKAGASLQTGARLGSGGKDSGSPLADRAHALHSAVLDAHVAGMKAPASDGDPATRVHHLMTTDANGNPAFHAVHGDEARAKMLRAATARGMTVEEGRPADLSGAPKGARDLHAHGLAHGWDMSYHPGDRETGQFREDGPPVRVTDTHVVYGRNPDQSMKVTQSWIGGKKTTYNSEPLTRSTQTIGRNPRTAHMPASADDGKMRAGDLKPGDSFFPDADRTGRGAAQTVHSVRVPAPGDRDYDAARPAVVIQSREDPRVGQRFGAGERVVATRLVSGEFGADRSSEHSAAARQLASEARGTYSPGGTTTRAAGYLDEAAAHLDGGRDSDAAGSMRTAIGLLDQHHSAARSSRMHGHEARAERGRDMLNRAGQLRDDVVRDRMTREGKIPDASAANIKRDMALNSARRHYLGATTGLSADDLHAKNMHAIEAHQEIDEARRHLLAGRFDDTDKSLAAAVQRMREAPGNQQKGIDAIERQRVKISRAAELRRRDVNPALAPLAKNPDGSVRAIDHRGNEYDITRDGNMMTVTRDGVRAVGNDGGKPNDFARVLAGRLSRKLDTPEPAPRKISAAERARQPVISASGREAFDELGKETNDHLDAAAKALAEGRTDDTVSHLNAAALASHDPSLTKRIDNQRDSIAGGKPGKLKPGEERVLAEGEHNGVRWTAVERNTPGVIGNVTSYRLSHDGQSMSAAPRGRGPHQASEDFRQETAGRAKEASDAAERQRAGITETIRIMQDRDRAHQQNNPLSHTEIQDAYKAWHGRGATPKTLQRWAYSGSNDTDRNADWHKAGVAAKQAGRPVQSIRIAPHAAEIDRTADAVDKDSFGAANRAGGVVASLRAAASAAREGDQAGATRHLESARNRATGASAGYGRVKPVMLRGGGTAGTAIDEHIRKISRR